MGRDDSSLINTHLRTSQVGFLRLFCNNCGMSKNITNTHSTFCFSLLYSLVYKKHCHRTLKPRWCVSCQLKQYPVLYNVQLPQVQFFVQISCTLFSPGIHFIRCYLARAKKVRIMILRKSCIIRCIILPIYFSYFFHVSKPHDRREVIRHSFYCK